MVLIPRSPPNLQHTYPLPFGAIMKARALGQSFITCPMPLQRWNTMLVDLLKKLLATGTVSWFVGPAHQTHCVPHKRT
jgi:hypothetical protein